MESSALALGKNEWLSCCGCFQFAQEMAAAEPFASYDEALNAATDIWFNKVHVTGWLEAFSAHPQIGESPSQTHKNLPSAEWSKGEQSTALATATDSTLQELYEWNARYRQKFGFVFLIFASGRSTPEILAEIKRRYQNRPVVEFELAAKEQMKITALRLSKLLSANATSASTTRPSTHHSSDVAKAEDRMNVLGGHLASASETPAGKSSITSTRTRPPITTHVLDVSRGSPAAGIDVLLEMWKGNLTRPSFGEMESESWKLQGASTTDKDGRSGRLMNVVDDLQPGIYRISFNTGKYVPDGFFPYVSIVFEVRHTQKHEHFHVPLLLSPFGFSTYRGS